MAMAAGLLMNTVVVMGAEWLLHQAYPPPPGLDMHDPAAVERAMRQAPPILLIGVMAGMLLGAFLAGTVTSKLAESRPRRLVLLVGFFLLLTNALNAFSFWHPQWFRIAAVVLPLPLALLGGQAMRKPENWK